MLAKKAGTSSGLDLKEGSGRPRSNIAQNKQFKGAVQEIESQLGRELTKTEIRQLHEALHELETPGFWDIVNEDLNMFESKKK